ncbi:hypothetical protein G7074_14815 [Pedobacter sp. HDW13]|uniref:hypothetical protein n=1 Tax=Pedobacter sp. HDW13 TaxID=2714940 RepID=UPI0014097A23|nr:hypothetical protein [Pedobacter sp. HDW13]QIL40426.1 hypothetical protein G7074_14815 [Pedobacter sp. HDW13]
MTDLKLVPGNLDNLSEFEQRLIKSLRGNGHLFPLSDEEIEHFEDCHKKEIRNAVSKVPSADDILKRGRIEKNWTITPPVDEEVSQNMAQAAREGKAPTDAIKQKMLDDRNKSKNK